MDDLEINNYNLEDILNLFKLPYDFSEKGMKAAYKQALMTHPDKSGLSSNYFHFFMKAYKVIAQVFYFRSRKKGHAEEYIPPEIDKEQKILLDKIDKDNFNQWFNEMFEKVRIEDKLQDTGYEEWFRSNDDIFDTTNIPKNEIDAEFRKHKEHCKTLTIKKSIQELEHNGGGYDLLREKPEEYTSSLFSKLQYEDLKKAHIETVIPVTREDYEKVKKFVDVDSYKRYRNNQMNDAPSLIQSKQLLEKKKKEMMKNEAHRAYHIMKQDEEIGEKNKRWWGYLRQLTDG